MDIYTVLLLIGVSLPFLLLTVVLIKERVHRKRNPHLEYSFLASLSFEGKLKKPKVIQVNERLKLQLYCTILPVIEVYAKNDKNEFILVEKRSTHIRSATEVMKFDEPWHGEIAQHLEKMFFDKKEEKQKLEKQKENEINQIKKNWN